ncbi:hypothetical protein METHPM2_1550006 [Pseudomonas sp. PM2]
MAAQVLEEESGQHIPGTCRPLGSDHIRFAARVVVSPGHRVDAFAAGEHMAKVRLVAKATFQADLREAQGRAGNQLLGALDALLANPFLGRQPRGALEGAGKVAARQGAGLGQVGDCQAFAEVGKDQLLGDALTPGAQATGGGQPGGILLESGHDKYPQSMGTFPVDGCSVDALHLVAGPPG